MGDEYEPDVSGMSARRADLPTSSDQSVAQVRDGPYVLSEQSQRRIGTHLRALYEGFVQQPVPDRFRDLIEKLEAADKSVL